MRPTIINKLIGRTAIWLATMVNCSVAFAENPELPLMQELSASDFKFSSNFPTILATTGAVFRMEQNGNLSVIDINGDLQANETLLTDHGGSTLLGFPDGTQILLAENTRLKLKQFFYEEKSPFGDALIIELVEGSIRINTGKISKRSNPDALQVIHKSTVLVVRGTDFVARVCNENCPPKSGLNLVKSKNSVGRVLEVKGQVHASKSGVFADKVAPRALVLGSPLFKDDVIKTEPKSTIQLVFNDQSKINLEQNSELKIQELKMGESKKDNAFAANLTKGALRTVTGKVGKINPEETSFVTPTATIGIRGTSFDVVCATESTCNTNTSVAVRNGAVSVNSGGKLQAISQGLAYQFDAKTEPKAIDPNGSVFSDFQTPRPESTPINLTEQLENTELETPSGLYIQVNEGLVQMQNGRNTQPVVLAAGEGAFSAASNYKITKTGVPILITRIPALEKFQFYPASCF